MENKVFYRKYRPVSFDEVVDQNFIVSTLRNAIVCNKVSHAYIFCGSRGTGKTSTAKIFAKAINCLKPNNGNHCGKCENCLKYDSAFGVDIIELDAASNNGVDEIRSIISSVNFAPSILNYKVYIIDEVHMLSTGAFNALLKTLEEPPANVIFILATTEFHKIPSTIISRCQCFEFHKISIDNIKDSLKKIAKKEKIIVDDDVLGEIAIYSNGGLRDAIGLLDKISSFSNEKICLDDFNKYNNLVSIDDLKMFLLNVYSGEVLKILQQIKNFNDNGADFSKVIERLIFLLRDIIVDKIMTVNDNVLSISFCTKFLELLNDLYFKINMAFSVKIIFEVSIIEFIYEFNNKENLLPKAESIATTVLLKPSIGNNDNPTVSAVGNCTVDNSLKKNNILNIDESVTEEKHFSQLNKDVRINNVFVSPIKNMLFEIKEAWNLLKDYTFDVNYGAMACILYDSIPRVMSDDYLLVSLKYFSVLDNSNKTLENFEDFFEKVFNKRKKLIFVLENEWEILRIEYVKNLKNGTVYSLLEEKIVDNLIVCGKIDDVSVSKDEDFLNSLGQDIVEIAE